MDTIFQFIGKLIDMIYSYVPVYGICVLLLALLDKLLFYFAGKKYYSTIKLKEVLEPLVIKNNKKYADNPTKKTEELAKLLASNNYPIFGGIGNLITEAIMSLGLIGIFNNPKAYLAYAEQSGKMNFLFFDLTSSPVSLINSPTGAETDIIISVLLVAVTLGVFIIHDKIMEDTAFIDQSFNKAIWVIFAICFLYFNQAFTLYWFGIKAMDLIHIFIVKSFYKVTVKTNTEEKL